MAVEIRQTKKRPWEVRVRANRMRQRDRMAVRAEVRRRLHGHERGVDGAQVFDHQAWRTLSISGEQFLQNWDAGVYRAADTDEARAARRLALLLPLVRRIPA